MNPPLSPTVIYRDARALAKTVTLDTLYWWRDSLREEWDSAPDRWADVLDSIVRSNTIECDQFNAKERGRAVDDEISLRDRISGMSDAVRSERDREIHAWRDLTEAVRIQTDLPDVLRALGIELTRAGRDSRRGGEEWCGACPFCGGRDRLRVFSGPPGRVWCRQCRWSADGIAVAQSMVPGCDSFRDAVRYLADRIGHRSAVSR